MPEDVSLKDLGLQRMRGFSRGESVWSRSATQFCRVSSRRCALSSRCPTTCPSGRRASSDATLSWRRSISTCCRRAYFTLTGGSGCGKTRLCLEAAANLAETFPDGLSWVDLAPIADASLVAKAVATAVSDPEVPTEPIINTLMRALGDKSVLILLDNCEHVIDACADLVRSLISGTPSVSVLATSREPLGVEDEVALRVPSLSFPDLRIAATMESLNQYDAVRLFIDRANRASPVIGGTNEMAPAIAETVID